MTARTIAIVISLVTAGGCTIGKDYQRPPVEIPLQWIHEAERTRETANALWWRQFDDPVLDELIDTALRENKDVALAAARVGQYLGTYRSTRGTLFPRIEADVQASRQRVTREGAAPWPAGVSPIQDRFLGTLGASWEIDLWGKFRLAAQAARADILSAEESRDGVVLSLVAAVADGYLRLLSLDEQLEIARRTEAARSESLRIFKLRYDWGVVSELELSQIQSEYEETLAVIPSIEQEIALQEHRLNTLLGSNPAPIERGLTLKEIRLPGVPAGVPSDLLERRPDIRRAEQDLVAAHARVDVARSYYFPSISLTGILGTESADLLKLMSGSSQIWTLGAQTTLPLFTAGTVAGQVATARALREEALVTYQKTIQNAFKEVEDALVSVRKTREVLEARNRQVEAVRNYKKNAQLRYENGYSGYLEVLDADRTLFNTERSYVQAKTALFTALVDLYKSMGGGWMVHGDGPKGRSD